ncbi:allantoin permease [Mariannaea sp. PMI_226]|nr:allantoin permease [Mariannaea sp. PMI_226]
MLHFLQKLEVPHPPNEPRPTALLSHDVKPIEKERRVWGWPAFIALWSTIAFNMSNFQIGSSMLAIGLNWWQAFLTMLFGHILAAALVVAASFPGLSYNISFPVATRIAWGYFGSIFVVLNRIVLSIVWCGVQSWQGGLMTYVCLRAIWPSIDKMHNTIPASTGMTLQQFVSFILYFVIQLPFLFLSPKKLRYLVYAASGGGFVVQLVLCIWACCTMGSAGFGSIITSSGNKLPSSQLGWICVYSISVTISSITSGTVSVCDYARFAKSPRTGTWSQAIGFLPGWLSNVLGTLTIAATQNRYGAELWSVASLLVAIQDGNPDSKTRAGVFFAGLAFGISQIALNVVGNSFSGGTDMSSLVPKYINIRRGQLLTALLGLVINPWYLLSGAVIFISVMSAYTIFLQPFLGIVVAHYFIIQKRRIKVSDLYTLGTKSLYWYSGGINWRSVVAWVCGVVPHIPGFLRNVNPSIKVSAQATQLYYLSSFTGFLIPLFVAIGLHKVLPAPGQTDYVSSVSKSEAMEHLEEYIERLKFDFGVIQGEEASNGKTEEVLGEKEEV